MQARNAYILMGLHPSLMKNPSYTTLLRSSILWAAEGGEKTAPSDVPGPPK